MLAGLAVIAALSIGLGFLVTRVLEPISGIGTPDERVNIWLAAHRTPGAHRRVADRVDRGRRRRAADHRRRDRARLPSCSRNGGSRRSSVFALAVESATYRATTLVVHSHRPRVVRLENLPVNASYPSGHTAASLAVYGGLALLLTSRITNAAFRVWRLDIRAARW